MKKKWKQCYVLLFFLLCIIPLAAMFISPETESTENRTLAELPALREEDGQWNIDFLSNLGDYFQEHFGLRDELVTANARVLAGAGGVSAAEGVILGTDGWLYYRDSLEDYQGVDQLSDRALFDIAHTLAMVQQYAQDRGIAFSFAVAPNKNSLYDENMPYYYKVKVSKTCNLSRLIPYLEQEGVHYSNLYERLSSEKEILYHKRDSHWNNAGAAIAADEILLGLGKSHRDYTQAEYEIREDFSGDLDKMLYPKALTPEEEIYYQPQPEFLYTEEVESNFAPQIHTESLEEGSLVMYRDSFGNALLPFLAEAYGSAYFSRGVPYQLTDLDVCQADTLIIERAERFLPEMAENPPVMEAPAALPQEELKALEPGQLYSLSIERAGNQYSKVSGLLPAELLETNTRIYVRAGGELLYEAFPMCTPEGEEGFVAYLPLISQEDAVAEVYLGSGQS